MRFLICDDRGHARIRFLDLDEAGLSKPVCCILIAQLNCGPVLPQCRTITKYILLSTLQAGRGRLERWPPKHDK